MTNSEPSSSEVYIASNERMPILRAIGRALVRMLPRNEILFRAARKIVDRYNADNDFDMRTNGELHLAQAALPHASVVFDVGANQGDWAAVAHAINPRAQVHCFEPSSFTFELLGRRLSSSPNVILSPFGLGECTEERELWVYAEGAVSNSLYHRVGTMAEQHGTEVVRMRTLDDYCAENGVESIDFLKIDVEGHELSVFRGARRMFRESRIGLVQFEYNDTYIDARVQLKDVWQLMESTNGDYAFFKIYPEGLRHIPRYEQRYETFRYSNWALLRTDVVETLRAGKRLAFLPAPRS
jgi:FkbM family methyltransferase